ncbi:MAG: hypothetical protein C0615_00025 [Desulfuromonas sp.]|nr:MAG: hypothetical protein C0615_00025 [Desulfuromonas sp.]
MKEVSVLVVAIILVCLPQLVIAEENSEQTAFDPHKEALECLYKPCETRECLNNCDLLCTNCHSTPKADFNLSTPATWNTEGTSLTEVYPNLTTEEIFGLADICYDCHGDRFVSPNNHPVDIPYPPKVINEDLDTEPKGPFLICSDTFKCQMRCVTCHEVHLNPTEEKQASALLRMANKASALCISCHKK